MIETEPQPEAEARKTNLVSLKNNPEAFDRVVEAISALEPSEKLTEIRAKLTRELNLPGAEAIAIFSETGEFIGDVLMHEIFENESEETTDKLRPELKTIFEGGGRIFYITTFYTVPGERKKSYGQQMLGELLRKGVEGKQASAFVLATRPETQKDAQHIYQKFGFIELEGCPYPNEEEGIVEEKKRKIYMIKDVAPR